jgi:hypothetical protein
MNLMGILFSNNAEINMKDVTAIKILVGRSYRMMFIDDRTKHFQMQSLLHMTKVTIMWFAHAAIRLKAFPKIISRTRPKR